MNRDKLLGEIKSKGLKVEAVIKRVNELGVPLSKSTFYKGLNDKRPFNSNEIKALMVIVGLSEKDMMDIFYRISVLKDT